MKNIIPLIVAVILGLAAVFLVSRVLVKNGEEEKEPQVSVVIAARDLEAGEELRPGSCTFKNIPQSAMPKAALLWENVGLAYGQTLPFKIVAGDYIQLSDIKLNVTLADCVAQGTWLVPVTFADPALVKMLAADDEIAIVASYAESAVAQAPKTVGDMLRPDAALNTQVSSKRETVVLFPCVKVVGIANDKGSFRDQGGSSATIFVSLPPRQAMILLAAQREAELYPVLRKRNDTFAMNRKEIGVVNNRTFVKLRADLETAELSDTSLKTTK